MLPGASNGTNHLGLCALQVQNEITIEANNWVDDPDDVPNGFTYQYYFLLGCHEVVSGEELAATGQSPKIINPGVSDNRFKASLPPALAEYNNTFSLVVYILDSYGAAAITSMCISYSDMVIDAADAAGLATDMLGEDGSAGLAKATGDTDGLMMAFVSTAAALCAGNTECDSYMPAHDARRRLQTYDSDAYQTRYSILSDLNDVIAGDSLSTMSSIQQKLESIAVQTSVISEMSPNSQALSLTMVEVLLSALRGTGEALPNGTTAAAMLVFDDMAELTNSTREMANFTHDALDTVVQDFMKLLLESHLNSAVGSACGMDAALSEDYTYVSFTVRRICNSALLTAVSHDGHSMSTPFREVPAHHHTFANAGTRHSPPHLLQYAFFHACTHCASLLTRHGGCPLQRGSV